MKTNFPEPRSLCLFIHLSPHAHAPVGNLFWNRRSVPRVEISAGQMALGKTKRLDVGDW